MGDRGQVHIKDLGVWLYTHWKATELPDTIRRALARKERWDNPEYLARIIFCEMIRDDIEGTTGYGIGAGQHGDVDRVVEIDCQNKKVALILGDSDSWIKCCKEHGYNKDSYQERNAKWEGSFEDFINSTVEWYYEK